MRLYPCRSGADYAGKLTKQAAGRPATKLKTVIHMGTVAKPVLILASVLLFHSACSDLVTRYVLIHRFLVAFSTYERMAVQVVLLQR